MVLCAHYIILILIFILLNVFLLVQNILTVNYTLRTFITFIFLIILGILLRIVNRSTDNLIYIFIILIRFIQIQIYFAIFTWWAGHQWGIYLFLWHNTIIILDRKGFLNILFGINITINSWHNIYNQFYCLFFFNLVLWSK